MMFIFKNDQNVCKRFINIDEFRYVRYFTALSLEHSTFESPSLMQLFVGIRHRGIDCEHQSRPLGGSCYCILTPSIPSRRYPW